MKTAYSKIAPVWQLGQEITGTERGVVHFINHMQIDLPIQARILDVGCGSGVAGLALLRKYTDATALLTDIDPKMLVQARKQAQKNDLLERTTFGLADINRPTEVAVDGQITDLLPESFDLVVGSGILEHSNLNTAMQYLTSLVKPRGWILLINVQNNFIGKVFGKVYRFDPIRSTDVVEQLRNFTDTKVTNLEKFPTKFTRQAILARKV